MPTGDFSFYRRPGVRLTRVQSSALAREAHAQFERGMDTYRIAYLLKVSEPTARNLVAYGRRLAAGQPEKLDWH